MAQMGGCLCIGLQAMKDKQKEHECFICSLAVEESPAKKWQIRMAGLESYPCNSVLHVLAGRKLEDSE